MHFFRSVRDVIQPDIATQTPIARVGLMIAASLGHVMMTLKKVTGLFAPVAALGFTLLTAPNHAKAVDISTVLLVGPGAVQAVAEEADALEVEKSPKRQPYELKRIYRRYRQVFRTVAKGVDLSQEIFGIETRGDTLRVRFRPTSTNPERMGGVVSCNLRF